METRNTAVARLIALLLTDGGLCEIGKRWRVHFTSNSEQLKSEFQALIKNLFNLKMSKDYRKGAWRVKA